GRALRLRLVEGVERVLRLALLVRDAGALERELPLRERHALLELGRVAEERERFLPPVVRVLRVLVRPSLVARLELLLDLELRDRVRQELREPLERARPLPWDELVRCG